MLTVLKHSTLSFKNCHLIEKAANILKPAGDVMHLSHAVYMCLAWVH